MLFDKPIFDKLFKGFKIIDCAMRNKNRQAYVLISKNQRLRFVFTYNDEVDIAERYYFKEFKNASPSAISFSNQPIDNFVAVSQSCGVYAYDKDFDGLEVKLPEALEDTRLVSVIFNTSTIKNTIYAVGYPNKLHKRIGKDNWQDISAKMPSDIDDAMVTEYFYRDVDGFSETDIYIVGGEGVVHHFDGENYTAIAFPNKDQLHNVCCAGDGNVYVGAQGTSLYKWDKKSWQCLQPNGGINAFLDIKWFKGKLYCGEEGRLRVLENNTLETVTDNYPQGNIDVAPDGNFMLVAARDKACLFDGEKWEVLFDGFNY